MNNDLVAEIREARFTPVRLRRGYLMEEVDALLDDLADAVQQGRPVRPLIDASRFTTGTLRETYKMADVDGFLTRLTARLAERSGETP